MKHTYFANGTNRRHLPSLQHVRQSASFMFLRTLMRCACMHVRKFLSNVPHVNLPSKFLPVALLNPCTKMPRRIEVAPGRCQSSRHDCTFYLPEGECAVQRHGISFPRIGLVLIFLYVSSLFHVVIIRQTKSTSAGRLKISVSTASKDWDHAACPAGSAVNQDLLTGFPGPFINLSDSWNPAILVPCQILQRTFFVFV